MKIDDLINELEQVAAVTQPEPVNPDFVSLAELLLRMQLTKRLTMKQAAHVLLSWGFRAGGAPAWIVNGKQGIHPLDATQEKFAIRRLEYVFHRGQFECDGPDSGASIDYEIFGFDRKEFSKFLAEKVGEPLDLFGPMPDTAPAQTSATPAPAAEAELAVEPASDGPAKPHTNKSVKTLIFEAKVLELLGKFWNDRTPGTVPTKGELCKLVYDEILRTPVRGARKTTRGMVSDAAKLWKMPIVLPALVPDSKFNDKRHPFKGDI